MDYSEKEIEEFIFDNPHILNLGLRKDGIGWERYRQLDLKDYGIADIVVFDWNRNVIYVIEVKKDASKPADFAQCLRYMRAMRGCDMKVRGIIAANGMAGDSPFVLSNLTDVTHWSFNMDIGTGLAWQYEVKDGWYRGTDNRGDQLSTILEEKGNPF